MIVFKRYLIGLFLSILLTLFAFQIVKNFIFSNEITFFIVIISSILQILIHLIFFLDIDFFDEDHWKIIIFLFSLLIIGIIVGGSLWIMSNLRYNMMI